MLGLCLGIRIRRNAISAVNERAAGAKSAFIDSVRVVSAPPPATTLDPAWEEGWELVLCLRILTFLA